jgi:alpha-beta hydrolase superfamily lysophospholipase
LQALNLGESGGEIWSGVDVPVLVLRGSSDTIMSHADNVALADAVNRTHPGRAEYTEIPNVDHLLSIHDKVADSAVSTILSWLRRRSLE